MDALLEMDVSLAMIGSLFALAVGYHFLLRPNKRDIPWATGAIPLIGHALAFKDDPPGFLRQEELKVGKVFRVNLAGRVMVIIGSDRMARKQVENKPESTCSARKAVADVGFEYTLGKENVYTGSDYHRIVVKKEVYTKQDDFLKEMIRETKAALEAETRPGAPACEEEAASADLLSKDDIVPIKNLFELSRRVALRCMTTLLLSPVLLSEENNGNGDDDFLTAFMTYQDHIEDATAKNAVLPGFLAIPLILWPVQRERLELTKRLARLITKAWGTCSTTGDATTLGPWLRSMKDEHMEPVKAAELCIGLLYASHKSPSIGVSQTFCYLLSRTSDDVMQRARQEAVDFVAKVDQNDNNKSIIELLDEAPTLKASVLETMRHAAHTIGGIRTAQKDFELQGEDRTYSIKKGDVIAITHNIPNLYASESPKTDFDLDQWVHDGNNKSIMPQLDRMATFSGGIHRCPGRKFALWYMQTVLALWLAQDMVLADGDDDNVPPICFERATLAQRKQPIAVQMQR